MVFGTLFGGGKKGGFVVGDESLPGPPKTDHEVVAMCLSISKSLTKRLPTEQDIYWFVVEQYDRLCGPDEKVQEILSRTPLFHIEHRGRRSETSYVGKPNPGVVFLDKKVMPALEATFGNVAQRMRATIYVMFCDGFKGEIRRLRIKYAAHYHNNCLSNGHFNKADEWSEVISALESGEHETSQNPPTKADEGDLTSQYNSGVMYLNGQGGVSRNLEMAYKAFRSAAENGHVGAQYNLGVMYNTGTHVKTDAAAAASWFTKAAENGHANAAFNLAHLFLTGSGVEQNTQQAHLYLCLAADKGHPAALDYVHNFLASKGLDKNGAPLG